jgi:uncharacterized protein YidB (DUF937 family)
MGLLDSVIGAMAGQQPSSGGFGGNAALLNLVLGMLADRGDARTGPGGLGALVEQFQRGGLGDVIGSWVSNEQNLPISGDQLGGVLGSDLLSQIAGQLGMSQHDAAEQLSQVLPQAVDRVTPDGRVPDGGLGSIGDILARFS